MRFGQTKGRAYFAAHQGVEPALLLKLGGAHSDQLGIAGIRPLTTKDFRCQLRATENFVHQRESLLPHALTAVFRLQMGRPQAALFHHLLQRCPQGIKLCLIQTMDQQLQRDQLLIDEMPHPVEFSLEIRVGRKIPGHGCSCKYGYGV